MGYMVKSGTAGKKGDGRFQRRWFVLEGSLLHYFESERAHRRTGRPKGTIALIPETRLAAQDGAAARKIQIVNPQRTFTLIAAGRSEMETWLYAVRDNLRVVRARAAGIAGGVAHTQAGAPSLHGTSQLDVRGGGGGAAGGAAGGATGGAAGGDDGGSARLSDLVALRGTLWKRGRRRKNWLRRFFIVVAAPPPGRASSRKGKGGAAARGATLVYSLREGGEQKGAFHLGAGLELVVHSNGPEDPSHYGPDAKAATAALRRYQPPTPWCFSLLRAAPRREKLVIAAPDGASLRVWIETLARVAGVPMPLPERPSEAAVERARTRTRSRSRSRPRPPKPARPPPRPSQYLAAESVPAQGGGGGAGGGADERIAPGLVAALQQSPQAAGARSSLLAEIGAGKKLRASVTGARPSAEGGGAGGAGGEGGGGDGGTGGGGGGGGGRGRGSGRGGGRGGGGGAGDSGGDLTASGRVALRARLKQEGAVAMPLRHDSTADGARPTGDEERQSMRSSELLGAIKRQRASLRPAATGAAAPPGRGAPPPARQKPSL
eukprot:g6863.t1